MQRNSYQTLTDWKNSPRRKPLIMRGARQVGKTYLLKQFGAKEYRKCHYLNFEEDPRLMDFFKEQLTPEKILHYLSIHLNQEILPHEDLIFFDEIQECAEALNSLKYFCEQAPEYHIASAGSLLGIKLSQHKGFPVGKVNFVDLYPLTFEEFLIATKQEKLAHFLTAIKTIEPLPEVFHHELITSLKKYFIVGGMPEAVAYYQEKPDFTAVRTIQNEIIDAYVLDFVKHAPKTQVMKLSEVWKNIPAQLAKENKKFIFSALSKTARGREYEETLQWLTDIGLIHRNYHINTPKLPLDGYSNKNFFKVFLLDVGLLAAMSNLPARAILDNDQLFQEFNRAFTENFVAQELAANHIPLYYWSHNNQAEIDFILEKDLQIFPLEVKAGTSRHKKSLSVYREKYQPTLSLRTSLLNLKQDDNFINIPLYLINRVGDLLNI